MIILIWDYQALTLKNQQADATILLVDNGSTRADATLQLRHIAQQLSKKIANKVFAVSLKHSDQINIDEVNKKLDGIPAQVFTEFMTEQLHTGIRRFIVIPLFFGESRALTSYIPDEKEKLEAQFGTFELNLSDVLYPLPNGNSILIDILVEHALITAKANTLRSLVLVDHGTPLSAVNEVRQHIAKALSERLPDTICVSQAVMERRAGEKYDFNGELLEDYLIRLAKAGETQVHVLLQFLLPGTHAGKDGDIIQICNKVMQQYPELKVSISPLIGEHQRLVDCLAQRYNDVISAIKQDINTPPTF